MNQSQKLTLRGIEMAFTDVGPKTVNAPAVLLLHGFPFDRSMWREQIEALRNKGFRALAPDLRGSGQTQWDGEVAAIEDMARDVAGLLDRLRIDQAVICGLSMGVYVALEFISLFPSRVRGLVLAGGRVASAGEAEKKSREEQADRVLNEGMSSAVDSMLKNLLAPNTLASNLEVVLRVGEMVKRSEPRGVAAVQHGLANRRDYSGDLKAIRVPTLIIAGREDNVRKPEDAKIMHQGIENSTLKVIEQAGHLMNIEQPEIFNLLLLAFLEQLSQQSQHRER